MVVIIYILAVAMMLLSINVIARDEIDGKPDIPRVVLLNAIGIVVEANFIVLNKNIAWIIATGFIIYAAYILLMSQRFDENKIKRALLTYIIINAASFVVTILLLVTNVIAAHFMLIYSLIMYILYRLYCKMQEDNKYFILYGISLTVYTGVFIIIEKFANINGIANEVLIIFILISYIVMLIFFDWITRKQTYDMEGDILERQKQFYSEQIKTIKESENLARGIRHDMKNHINTIYMLLQRDKCKEALGYLDKIKDKIDMTKPEINSGNLEIDAILNSKIMSLRNKGIEFKCDLKIPEKMNFEAYDMVVIIGNMLDNAINAEDKLSIDNKKINLNMDYRYGALNIKISNDCDSSIENQEREVTKRNIPDILMTTNVDKHNHGFGIKNILSIIEKYGGNMNVTVHDSRFEIKIILAEVKIKRVDFTDSEEI